MKILIFLIGLAAMAGNLQALASEPEGFIGDDNVILNSDIGLSQTFSLSISEGFISPDNVPYKRNFCQVNDDANLGIDIQYNNPDNSTAKKIICKWKLKVEIIEKNGSTKYKTLLKGKFKQKNVSANTLLEFRNDIREKLNKKLRRKKFANSFVNDELSAKLYIDLKGKVNDKKGKFTDSAVYDVTIYKLSPSESPSFAGIMLAYAVDTDKIELAWPEASDDNTIASGITYNIYKGSVDNLSAVYQSANLVKSVEGKTEAEITGLSVGTKYYFLVVAENIFGNKNENHKLVPATTMSNPLVIKKELKDITGLVVSQISSPSNLKGNYSSTSTITLNGDYSSTYFVDNIISAENIPQKR